MKVKCFLPYDDYNEGSFDVNDDYYKGDGYKEALINDLKALDDAQNGLRYSYSMLGEKVSKNEDKVHFSSCDAILYNDSGNEESVERLVNHISISEPYICILSFDYSNMEEEFEYDLKTWIVTYNKINTLNGSDEFKFSKQPRKTILVKFVDENGFENCINFVDCRIVSFMEDVGLVMIVDKLNFEKCVE